MRMRGFCDRVAQAMETALLARFDRAFLMPFMVAFADPGRGQRNLIEASHKPGKGVPVPRAVSDFG